MRILPGTLKCVIAPDGRVDRIESKLREQVRDEDVVRLNNAAVLAHTNTDTATIRDWLAALEVSVLVVEFKVWSAYGQGIDRDWLRDRGH